MQQPEASAELAGWMARIYEQNHNFRGTHIFPKDSMAAVGWERYSADMISQGKSPISVSFAELWGKSMQNRVHVGPRRLEDSYRTTALKLAEEESFWACSEKLAIVEEAREVLDGYWRYKLPTKELLVVPSPPPLFDPWKKFIEDRSRSAEMDGDAFVKYLEKRRGNHKTDEVMMRPTPDEQAEIAEKARQAEEGAHGKQRQDVHKQMNREDVERENARLLRQLEMERRRHKEKPQEFKQPQPKPKQRGPHR